MNVPILSLRALKGFVSSAAQVGVLVGLWAWARRHWLVVLALLLSDVLLALLVALTASTLQGFWGQGPITAASTEGMVASAGSIVITMMVWILMRALLGLYPGYGLNQVEELRRQTYTALVALAVTATLAFALQVGDLPSRLLVGLSSLELLLLSPLVRHLAKWGLGKVGGCLGGRQKGLSVLLSSFGERLREGC